ncbi:MAG: hypothetical protein Q8L48_11720 [Archangium sp.]|nr:hypothetical protein [Archangium sp.]
MKRYRVVQLDFDTRATVLDMEIGEDWEEPIKEMHRTNHSNIRAGIIFEFGAKESARKLADFMALGPAPFSVLAFHNKFFQQVRDAFVLGAYYPALTAACALGERILNHLVLTLRGSFRATDEFKKVAKKESFDDWKITIGVLRTWGVLLPGAAEAFERLRVIRHRVIHFSPATETNDRSFALDAIRQLSGVIEGQFSGRGPLPWFMHDVPGVTFVRKSFEEDAFVRAVVLPSCRLVGPLHEMRYEGGRLVVHDQHDYDNREVTDEDFARMAAERSTATNPEREVDQP